MSKRDLIILAVVGAILLLITGTVIGIKIQSKIASDSLTVSKQMQDTIKVLNSKTTPSALAYGLITKIEGRNITISSGGDSSTIKIRDDASIIIPVTDSDDPNVNTTVQKNVDFSYIKVGDTVNINLKVGSEGQLEGDAVIILPIPNTNTTSTNS